MIVVVVGGTGTLGRELVPLLFQDPKVSRVRILSRHEHEQAVLADEWRRFPVDFFVGDVRDAERVERALKGAHFVFHLAATKRVEACEYNPEEAIKTNVDGTLNVIRACRNSDTIERAIYTGTDKAVEPINTYGISKALAEKLWIQGNIGLHRVRFSCLRYGNVLGSQGSVIPTWIRQSREKLRLTVTGPEMTRFFLTKRQAAEFVRNGIYEADGGEVFIPKMKSIKMFNLLQAFRVAMGWPDYPHEEVPRRPGEKEHEIMIAEAERDLVTEHDGKLIRWPDTNLFPVRRRGIPYAFGYTSQTADRWGIEEMAEEIKKCAT